MRKASRFTTPGTRIDSVGGVSLRGSDLALLCYPISSRPRVTDRCCPRISAGISGTGTAGPCAQIRVQSVARSQQLLGALTTTEAQSYSICRLCDEAVCPPARCPVECTAPA